MFSKVIVFCAVAAVSQAGLLAAPAQYSSAAAVSSQSIVRHDQPQLGAKLLAAPVAKLALAAPVYSAPAPIAYRAPIAYQSAPIAYQSAPIAYQSAPIAKVIAQPEEYAHPKYEFSYSVADAHTGDKKQQQEARDGDVVKGSYSFLEADGSVRTVQYAADDHSGFTAEVHNSVPTAAPALVKAAPLLLKAPAYAAPALQYYH